MLMFLFQETRAKGERQSLEKDEAWLASSSIRPMTLQWVAHFTAAQIFDNLAAF
jgi:hypothetical protein